MAILLAPLHRQIAMVVLSSDSNFTVTSSFLLTAPVWEASCGFFATERRQVSFKDIVLPVSAISLLNNCAVIVDHQVRELNAESIRSVAKQTKPTNHGIEYEQDSIFMARKPAD